MESFIGHLMDGDSAKKGGDLHAVWTSVRLPTMAGELLLAHLLMHARTSPDGRRVEHRVGPERRR